MLIHFRKTVNLYPFEDKIITGQKNCIAVGIQIERVESGFAFSNFDEFEKNPCDSHIKCWSSKYSTLTRKLPNSILLDCDQTFVAFGLEAEDQYSDLLKLGSHDDCYFFKHFTKNISELMAKFENGCSEVRWYMIKSIRKLIYRYKTITVHKPTKS